MCRCEVRGDRGSKHRAGATIARWTTRRASHACLAAVVLAGCQQEMASQPRYDPLQPSRAFTDGLWSREPPPGTVARGQLRTDEAFFTGRVDGQLVTELPERAVQQATLDVMLARGRERFNIFCSHCHGQVGGGIGGDEAMREAVGMVVQRGFPAPPTYHQQRLRQLPIGHFFDVITNGLGRMPAHGYMIPPEDRWAIVAYVRALQLSQHAPRDRLNENDLAELDTTGRPVE